MNKPNLVCGSHNVSPEHPSDWDVRPLSGIALDDSLGGTQTKDVFWRKYRFVLEWNAMNLTDFYALEDLINYHNDTGTPIQFVYEKFRESQTIRQVSTPPLPRSKRGGKGNSNYYQTVNLELTEIDSRT